MRGDQIAGAPEVDSLGNVRINLSSRALYLSDVYT